MAAPCAECGGKRTSGVHSKHHPTGHAYQDPSKAGLKNVSDGRAAYVKSQEHKDAMALSAGATDCWPAAYGAPGECYGAITPSHTLSSGAHGGLEAADKYPVPPACSWHNAALEQDAAVRAWGEITMFTHGNRQYPFKISREWVAAEVRNERA